MTNKQNIKKLKKSYLTYCKTITNKKLSTYTALSLLLNQKKTVPKSIPSTHVNHNVINKRSKRAERSNHIGVGG